jgi:Flp pilus assembly protein TadB
MSEPSKMNTSWWYALVGGLACSGISGILVGYSLGLSRMFLCLTVGIFLWMVKDLGTARIKREAEYDEMKAEIAQLKKENESLKSGGSET